MPRHSREVATRAILEGRASSELYSAERCDFFACPLALACRCPGVLLPSALIVTTANLRPLSGPFFLTALPDVCHECFN